MNLFGTGVGISLSSASTPDRNTNSVLLDSAHIGGRSGLGNVIHLDVAFPLDGDSTISRVQYLVTTKQSF